MANGDLSEGSYKALAGDQSNEKDVIALSDDEDDHYPGSDHAHKAVEWSLLISFLTSNGRIALTTAICCSVISGIIFPFMAILLGETFDIFARYSNLEYTNDQLLEEVEIAAIRLAVLGVVVMIFNGLHSGLWSVFGEAQAVEARQVVLDGLLSRDLEWFDRRRKGVAAIVSRAQLHIRELEKAVSSNLGFVLQAFVVSIISIAIALYHSWKLTLVIMAGAPPTLAILKFMTGLIPPLIANEKFHLSCATKSAHRAISAIETVKVLNGQPFEISVFSKASNLAGNIYRSQALNYAAQHGLSRFMLLAMFVQGFWYGGTLVWRDPAGLKVIVSTGDVMTTFWSCLMAALNIQTLVGYYRQLDKGRLAAVGLESMRYKPQGEETAGLKLGLSQGNIHFRNVSFAYPSRPSQLVLSKVTIAIPAHKTTWIVGKSGSGKSTLGSLIMKAYSPRSGMITLSGRPLEEIDTKWLRENVTLVQQNSTLFNDTIFKNIALGKGDDEAVTMGEVRKAMDMVGGQQFVEELESEWNTMVGVGGGRISGGQRQRVVLARTIVRNAPYLILDEAVGSLDQISREKVMTAIRDWRKDKTTLIITHDVSQIPDDDLVYCLDGGHVVQVGSRKMLEKKVDGYFMANLRNLEDLATLSNSSKASQSYDLLEKYESVSLNEGKQFSTFLDGGSPDKGSEESHVLPKQRRKVNAWAPEIPLSDLGSRIKSHLRQYERSRSMDEAKIPTIYDRGYVSKSGQRKETSHFQIPRTIWPSLTRHHQLFLVLGAVFALIQAAATPAFSLTLGNVLNLFISTSDFDFDEFTTWSIRVIYIALIDGFASFWTLYFLASTGQAWVTAHKIQAFQRIMAQPKEWFDDPVNAVSGLIEDLEKHAEEMKTYIDQMVGRVFVGMLGIGISVSLAMYQSWKLTLVVLVVAPTLMSAVNIFTGYCQRAEEGCNQAAEECGAVMMEAVENVATVKLLGLEGYFRRRFGEKVKRAWRLGLRRSIWDAVGAGGSEAVMLFVQAILFYYGALLVASEEHLVDYVVCVFTLISFCLGHAAVLSSTIPQLSNTKDTAYRVLHLSIALPPTSHEFHGIFRPTQASLTGLLHFQNISFTYPTIYPPPANTSPPPPPSPTISTIPPTPTTPISSSNLPATPLPALTDVTLTLPPPPNITLLTGPSGCGKSTLCKLLLRIYPPTKGSIVLDNTPLSRFNTTILRELITLVPQSPVLFPGLAIRQNLLYGMASYAASSVTQDDLEYVCRICQVHDFITNELPGGYESILGGSSGEPGASRSGGAGGCGLSGGQVKRFAIARAMVRCPKILVLDEPWEGLDNAAEKTVGEGVRRWAEERGVKLVVVTHGGGVGKGGYGQKVVVKEGRVVGVHEFGNWRKEVISGTSGE